MTRTPITDALMAYKRTNAVQFDVPFHKQKGTERLAELIGTQAIEYDFNSMKALDNLGNPTSVIAQSERQTAEFFGAANAFYMVNGTTGAVQAMMLDCLKTGDKVIITRNAHKCATNGLILTGAEPIYADEDVVRTIEENKDAKAVFVVNPSYDGERVDLLEISRTAHSYGMSLMVDEAHGGHEYLAKNRTTAMSASADYSAVSMHKTCGALTQAAVLLTGESVPKERIMETINMTQTTSPSYLLMASIECARADMEEHGREYARILNHLYGKATDELRIVPNVTVLDRADRTKLEFSVKGYSGMELYERLRDDFGIQAEYGDAEKVLLYLSYRNTEDEIERVVEAVGELAGSGSESEEKEEERPFTNPKTVMSPKEASSMPAEKILIHKAVGRIASETVMCYPPGIPIISPGELISEEIVDRIIEVKFGKYEVHGAENGKIRVVKEAA